jgi:hypothetical protein
MKLLGMGIRKNYIYKKKRIVMTLIEGSVAVSK